jgi:N-acylneuraminate cytidylyltransferase/CMP-N,N'-diacetyllegionaminic acid synthase
MINSKTVLAIIPARGGSKGLPKKNIKLMNGKPLIQWTIETALQTTEIDTVLVTTDCPEIKSVALAAGAECPFLRPVELASDTATSFDAVKHSLDFYAEMLARDFDIIILLEPTSPLRESSDLSNMLIKLDQHFETHDGVVSLGEVSEHPSIIKIINSEGSVLPYDEQAKSSIRRQDCSKVYFPFGVAYIVKKEVLLNEKTFYPKRTLPFEIKRYQCYEIDDIYDFLAIENIMKFEWNLK